jgi:hypothetical protein
MHKGKLDSEKIELYPELLDSREPRPPPKLRVNLLHAQTLGIHELTHSARIPMFECSLLVQIAASQCLHYLSFCWVYNVRLIPFYVFLTSAIHLRFVFHLTG